jgi:hypothetical protein
LTSLVSYKSPDNVPDTFTPDVAQPIIRSLAELCNGYTRKYPVSTSLIPNEASVGISLYSAPFYVGISPHESTSPDFLLL